MRTFMFVIGLSLVASILGYILALAIVTVFDLHL